MTASGLEAALERRAVLVGGLLAAAVAVPASVVGQSLRGESEDAVVLAFLLAVLGGFALGGHEAARRAPAAPLTNGAMAAVAAFMVVQGAGVVRRLVVGEGLRPASMALAALLACSAGLIGALVARTGGRDDRGGQARTSSRTTSV